MNNQEPVTSTRPEHLCSPGTALGLGIIPGVGALCNGEYLKAFVHVMVFGFLISIANTPGLDSMQPTFSLFTIAFCFYMPIEAFHAAKRRQLESQGLLQMAPAADRRRESLWVGLVLTVMGGLLFLDTVVHGFILRAFQFWPLVLIGFGTAKVASHLKKRRQDRRI
jgi:hypothetical protein